ncbi:MAG: hypothetical protein HN352_03050 [Bacteroidetes bacterium]|jgi:uncharacterized protein (TIGR02145 family)|nr:hypothetical protein [Bacteroidota bacterium]MBT3748246.1 hypothetical protein [Bacteroidota bacterium]MBT4401070.1 hypothetical protein [Bacteroidota bacterium]MBT4408648.1 hypothetical protein [Bacteroidota bacterium]MBT5427696.1 hypothetical protein [Bacteroidota bacterium]
MRILYLFVILLIVASCGPEVIENTHPSAQFKIAPVDGTIETSFTMDASESSDAEDLQALLNYRWDWESDGSWDTDWLSDPVKRKRYLNAGVYPITLEVKDSEGLSAKAIEFVNVSDLILFDQRDEQSYNTVKIGDQLWMAENLNYESLDGSWCHSNLDENCETYGKLYNWHTAGNICPAGWKLPSSDDWDQLISFVGANPNDQLRSDYGWTADHNGNNSSGFNALPASFRTAFASFSKIGSFAYFWEADDYSATKAWSRLFFYNRSDIERNYQDKENGFSVRCIKY